MDTTLLSTAFDPILNTLHLIKDNNIGMTSHIEDDTYKIPLPGIGKENICVNLYQNNKVEIKIRDDKTQEYRTIKYIRSNNDKQIKDVKAKYTDGMLELKIEQNKDQHKKIEVH